MGGGGCLEMAGRWRLALHPRGGGVAWEDGTEQGQGA